MSTPSSSRALELVGYCSFVALGVQAVLLPSLIVNIEGHFHQSDAAFGGLYLAKSLLYALGGVTSGMLTERAGRKAILVSAAVLSVVTLVIGAAAPWWWLFVAGAAAVTLGGAVIDAGVNGLFLDVFRESRGGALNFLHLFFSVGALVAPIPIGLMLSAGVPWRLIIFGSALPFAVVAMALPMLPVPSGRRAVALQPRDDIENPSERSLVPFFFLGAAIAFYVAQEIGVSSWVVRLLSDQPLTVATAALSIFWGGLSLGRLVSRWGAEILDYTTFTVLCVVLASVTLAGAVLIPWLPAQLVLYGLAGLFSGPIYPMIMVLGGELYPHRLAALSGGLTGAAAVGGIVYPPLMGFMAAQVGLAAGMMGAALLGVPAAASVLLARRTARRGVGDAKPREAA